MYTLTLPFVKSATAGFVKADAVREILSLSLVSGKNCILFGPGGHGKSEMTAAILAAVTDAISRTQMFGEGMDEARLYGGINLGKLNDPEKPVVEYYPERSFLSWDFAVFEELFDAPTQVLMSLKDTLTSKALRNGEQQFPMRTLSIVCATNREPGEVAEIGAAAQALIERFPLQLRVAWTSYLSSDYLEMFKTVGREEECSISMAELEALKCRAKKVVVPESVQRILAEMIANAVASGVTISPRSAMYAQDLVRASAVINGRNTATKDDIQAIKYLPGCEELAAKISSEIEAAVKRAEAEGRMRDAESRLRELQTEFKGAAGSPIKLLQVAVKAAQFGDVIANLTVTDNLTDRRKALRDTTSKVASDAQAAALKATRV
jgi:MoxR-like ATPase